MVGEIVWSLITRNLFIFPPLWLFLGEIHAGCASWLVDLSYPQLKEPKHISTVWVMRLLGWFVHELVTQRNLPRSCHHTSFSTLPSVVIIFDCPFCSISERQITDNKLFIQRWLEDKAHHALSSNTTKVHLHSKHQPKETSSQQCGIRWIPADSLQLWQCMIGGFVDAFPLAIEHCLLCIAEGPCCLYWWYNLWQCMLYAYMPIYGHSTVLTHSKSVQSFLHNF